MKANVAILWIIGVFFLLAGAVYSYWSILDTGEIEWVGTVALSLTGVMSVFIAVYMWWSVMRPVRGHVYPEDREDADIDDGDPELGHYSPWSWWPVSLAGGASIFVMGIAISTFLLPIGLALTVVALIGWVYEYYRGNFVQR